MENKGRILGIDFGERRIGVAISDPTQILASPLLILERAQSQSDDHVAILDLAREHHANRIVVGWPRSLSGRDGPAAQLVINETQVLRATAGQDFVVDLHDERFTTVVATDKLRQAGSKRVRTDDAAAAVLLQAYLDGAP